MTAQVIDLTARLAQAQPPCPCPADRLDRLARRLREHLAATAGELLVPAPDMEQTLAGVLEVVEAVLADYPPHQRSEITR